MDFENIAIPVCSSLGNAAPKSNYNTVYPKNRTERTVTVSLPPRKLTEVRLQLKSLTLSSMAPSLLLCP